MFSTSCPQCGAPLEFRSAAAVMAVCGSCRSTLLKHGEAVERLGEMAAVFEDYSPLQLGATGQYQTRSFTLLGRIQLRYDAGYWSEWYATFDDGSFGWLSDASGQYAVTTQRALEDSETATLPSFDSLSPGVPFEFDGKRYLASDIRTAQCVGGEGELPFRVGEGWQARVADFRYEDHFITLDYADADQQHGKPALYSGESVELAELACQGLRDEAEIRESAGRYRGDLAAFTCPSCGASLDCPVGVADYVICGSCHAGVDCSAPQATLFSKKRTLEAIDTALPLGASATFDGAKYTVLGLMRCRTPDGESSWDEYLLHNLERGFLWQVHSEGRWERVEVLNHWPMISQSGQVLDDGKTYRESEHYVSEVTYVAGAFNWRVQVGDKTSITDFAWRDFKMTREVTADEIVWSRARPLTNSKVAERFGMPELAAGAAASRRATQPKASESDLKPAREGFTTAGFGPWPWIGTGVMVFVNFGKLFEFDGSTVLVIIGILALWAPEWIWRAFHDESRSA
ncbi:DUF4178 domain-containing protein [Paraburkholderia bryophila]|uniref:DUF4178 domain-containing protein n=1 Tax=Paraburkholderia bryophila TaxID=420952 RepID=A0A7Z0B9P9_9BURK|nr:DUF4178 domain-containing protein [Paraburkholderia bryophila]NYH26554.1 hypothetical protein [Paraburkholderia bryophila]